MALDATNVLVALTGGVYRPDVGATLPTDADSVLHASVSSAELGYVSEDGITQTIDEQTTQIRAWQNGDTVRVVQTAHDLTFSFTAIESNDEVMEAYYGNVDAGTIEVNGAPGIRSPWVFDILDGDQHVRIVIPDGQVTDRGDITYVSSNAIGYPLTITCYPDPNYSGDLDQPAKAYIYRGDGGS